MINYLYSSLSYRSSLLIQLRIVLIITRIWLMVKVMVPNFKGGCVDTGHPACDSPVNPVAV